MRELKTFQRMKIQVELNSVYKDRENDIIVDDDASYVKSMTTTEGRDQMTLEKDLQTILLMRCSESNKGRRMTVTREVSWYGVNNKKRNKESNCTTTSMRRRLIVKRSHSQESSQDFLRSFFK